MTVMMGFGIQKFLISLFSFMVPGFHDILRKAVPIPGFLLVLLWFLFFFFTWNFWAIWSLFQCRFWSRKSSLFFHAWLVVPMSSTEWYSFNPWFEKSVYCLIKYHLTWTFIPSFIHLANISCVTTQKPYQCLSEQANMRHVSYIQEEGRRQKTVIL